MADKKISALTAASTPLAGTEVLPIVQSGATVKVSAADVTAGRDVSMKNLSLIGGAADLTATLTPSANTYNVDINFTNAAAASSGKIRYYPNSAYMAFWTANSERWRINYNSTASEFFAPIGVAATVGQKATSTHQAGNAGTVNLTIDDGGGASGVVVTNSFGGTYSSQEVTILTAEGGVSTATVRLKANKAGNIEISTGNVIQGTAAKGFDFSANTPAAGKTSTLLNWYEKGTFTPTISSGVTSPTYSAQNGQYTRIGDLVYFQILIGLNGGTLNSNSLKFAGLPFTSNNYDNCGGYLLYNSAINSSPTVMVDTNATTIGFNASGTGTAIIGTDLVSNTLYLRIAGQYKAA